MDFYQAAEKRPSAAFPSSFVVAAFVQVRLWPTHQLVGVARVAPYSSRRHSQDCLPDRQEKSVAGALHLGVFEQPAGDDFFSNLLYHGAEGNREKRW